jgi:hypothetical protein
LAFDLIHYHGELVGTVVYILVRIMEAMFVVGMVGSALVVILSGIEDARTISRSDEEEAP